MKRFRSRSEVLSQRAVRLLRVDSARYWLSTILAALVTGAGIGVAQMLGISFAATSTSVAVAYFAGWVTFRLTYSRVTWRVLHPVDGTTLSRWLHEDAQQHRRRRRAESMYATGGPTAAVVLCAVALVAVLCAIKVPDLRSDALVVVLAGAVVGTTWLLLVMVYAVHYARQQSNGGGLQFPGEDPATPPAFVDFLYLSAHMATSLSSPDVAVRTTSMRREVAVHSVIAFVFNTVVVALLVSLLISMSG